MSDDSNQNRRLLIGIMLAVSIWGAALALGAFLFGYDHQAGEVKFSPSPWRGLIVLACVATFVSFWAMLVSRRGKSSAGND
jgi:drug/metabolite transporter (DMT)-like permease